jgi:Uri superfamily endonuclease
MFRAECPTKHTWRPGVAGAAAERGALRLVWLTAQAIATGALRSAALRTAVSYVLVVRLRRPFAGLVGKLGRCRLEPGHYLYVGSARRGMARRVARHVRRQKVRRWHIDYLTSARAATVLGVVLSADQSECMLRKYLQERGCLPVLPGFGASDCSSGCESHLLRLAERDFLPVDLLRNEAQDGVQTFVLGAL